MADAGLTALIVAGRGVISHYGYLWFLVGYCPVVRWAAAVVLQDGPPQLIVPTHSDIWLAGNSGVDASLTLAVPSDGDSSGYADALADALAGLPAGSAVGVVGLEEIIPSGEFARWAKALAHLDLRPATDLLLGVKAVKTDEDIAQLRSAASIADDGLRSLVDSLRQTRDPRAAAGAAEARVRALGAHEVLVYVSAEPHFLHRPMPGPLRTGDLVTAFVEVSNAQGYWVEVARLLTVGTEIDQKRSDIIVCAQDALSIAETSLLSGSTAAEAHAAIRAFLDLRQVGSGLWYGHGVGIDHDLPTIGPGCETNLKAGMVVALHPHITSGDQAFGASLCDTFLVRADAKPAEPLSRIPRTPIVI